MKRSLCWLGFLMLMSSVHAADNNLQISGQLVAEPCTLEDDSTDITLDFGNLVNKYFYNTSRTPGEPFMISLMCDISLGDSVTVTFKGKESVALPGLLAPDDGSIHGLAFGLETDETTPRQFPLNTTSPIFTLITGRNRIGLRGYVQAEPDAITEHSLTNGIFTATATFQLDYP